MTEGEEWARELLAELRAERYRPAAWSRFLARSLRRAAEERTRRPTLRRRSRLVTAAGFAPAVALAAAGRVRPAAAAAAWWGTVGLMLDWHLGMVERPDGRRLDGLGAANVVTLARAAAVPLIPVLPPPGLSATVMCAAASDVLDGRLARRRDEVSRLGRWLDGAVDGVVLGVAAASLARRGLLPGGVARLVVTRHALPWALGAVAYFARAEAPPARAHLSGRVPGAAVWAGLAMAGLDLPGAGRLTAAGAAGGLGAVLLGAARAAPWHARPRTSKITRGDGSSANTQADGDGGRE